MTDDPLENLSHELTWRRKLNEAEEAQLRSWLASHPEAQAYCESEAALNEALDLLPDTPLANNFTARVLQAVEWEKTRIEPTHRPVWISLSQVLRWLPRTAVAALTLGLALISYQHFRDAHRLHMAQDAAVVSEVASLPNPKILEDFEAIHAMSQAPPADEELLKLLQ
jgi:anti-sigma factor RsiW